MISPEKRNRACYHQLTAFFCKRTSATSAFCGQVRLRIFAPSAGTVVAVNGLPGETADAEGIRDYSSQPQGPPITQQPLFSLFPEGPQPSTESGGSAAASLPVIALRTSSTWQVVVLVPENSVAAAQPGQVDRRMVAAHATILR